MFFKHEETKDSDGFIVVVTWGWNVLEIEAMLVDDLHKE